MIDLNEEIHLKVNNNELNSSKSSSSSSSSNTMLSYNDDNESNSDDSNKWRRRVNSQSSATRTQPINLTKTKSFSSSSVTNVSSHEKYFHLHLPLYKQRQEDERQEHNANQPKQYNHVFSLKNENNYSLSKLDKLHPWFYENLSREDTDNLLKKYLKIDGVFMVRTSKRAPDIIVLSFIFNGKTNHIQIKQIEFDHQLLFSLDFGKTKFYDIQQLIEFYQLNLSYLPTRLTHFLVHKSIGN